MKSIHRARIVVIAGGDDGLLLAARLERMEPLQVIAVPQLDDARRICRSGGADLCLVVPNDGFLDEMFLTIDDAPGRESGIPSLLLAHVMTPYLRRAAGRYGYRAVIPASLPPRMLYRSIGAALQRRPARRRVKPALAGVALIGIPGRFTRNLADIRKPTLH